MNIIRSLLALLSLACTLWGAGERLPDSLLVKTFPGKIVSDLEPRDFNELPIETRNRLVVEIARTRPLGLGELQCLSILAGENLIAEPSVIGYLVAKLERDAAVLAPLSPGRPATIVNGEVPGSGYQMALSILQQITRRNCGVAVKDGRDRDPASIRRVVDWWSQWWSKNHDKHPLFDAELRSLMNQRVLAIQSQLLNDVAPDYTEFGHLRYWVQQKKNLLDWVPGERRIFSGLIATSETSQITSHRGLDGKWRAARHGQDDIYLLITVAFNSPLPQGESTIIPHSRFLDGDLPIYQRILTEPLPDTDMVISVDAGPKESLFVKRVQASLKKLPPLRSEMPRKPD